MGRETRTCGLVALLWAAVGCSQTDAANGAKSGTGDAGGTQGPSATSKADAAMPGLGDGGASAGDLHGGDAGQTGDPDPAAWYPGIPVPTMPWWNAEVPEVTHMVAAGQVPDDVACGDVIAWRGEGGRVALDLRGCDDNPIWIVGDRVTLTAPYGNPHVISGSNLVLIGIDFRGEDGTLSYTGDRVVLRDITLSDPDTGNGSAFYIGGSQLVVAGSVIGPSGNWVDSGGPDIDHHCIKTGGADHVWILDSELKECQGDGIQIGDQNADGGHHIFLAGNRIHHNCQTGIWLKRGQDVVAVQNRIWGHDQGCQSAPVGAGAQYENRWFTLAYNEFWDNGGGIQIQSAEGGPRYFVGNVIHDCSEDPEGNPHAPHAITNRAGADETYILHNTVGNCAGAVGVVSGSGQGTLLHGNIWGAGSQDIEGALAEDTSNLDGDGQLDGDWVPRADSPAVDAAGSTHPAYGRWQDHYGLSLTHDRPLGAAWDIGARERPVE